MAFLTLAARAAGTDLAIEIDLTAQKAWLLHDGARIYTTPISSGRSGYRTRTGNFQVVQKDEDHLSTLYGSIVDAGGRTLVAGADSGMPVPKGGRFVAAPMHHFLRFDGATGMHAGHLPGYPASHGCVRLPPAKAALFYDIVEIGTPVRVFGTAPSSPEPQPKPSVTLAGTPVATPPPKKSWFPLFAKSAPASARKQTRPGNDSGPR
ncbi:MAG: L,D-transpeptidase [Chthoniobacter sp.]|nr:L,D-transpeptidase [Chthoniobacter sp.]